jgi:pimeloyl-ACP methyl ester carboxylesterase
MLENTQQVSANGLQITYESFGDPSHPAVVLIMGLGTQMIHWNDQFCQMLANNNLRVIRFDNRDIGKSTWLSELPVPSMWHFIGNSLFNKKVNAPYLLDDMADDTLASIMSTTGNRSLPKAKTKISAKLLKPMPKDIDAYVMQSLVVWKMLHGEHYSFDQARVEKLIRDSRQRGFNPAGVSRQLSAIIDSPDRTSRLQQLKVRSLVIHGDIDPLVPVECGIATAEAIPGAILKVHKGMGHTLPIQLWPEIVDDIANVIRNN